MTPCPVAALGRGTLAMLASIGRIADLSPARSWPSGPPALLSARIPTPCCQIGWLSLAGGGLTALFTGGALALQIYAGGARFSRIAWCPSIVAIGMVRELGPVLGGLMVAARVASSIAAELGTMKVTEQIDALVTLSTNPMKYLACRAFWRPRWPCRCWWAWAMHRHHGRLAGGGEPAGLQLRHLSARTRSIFWSSGMSGRAWSRGRSSGSSWR
jgi:hypothetical protein